MSVRKMISHCSECQQPLENPLDQLMGVCPNPLCRGPYFRKTKLQAIAERKAARRALAESTFEKWHIEIHECENQVVSHGPKSPTCVVAVPSCDRAIVPLPESRRQLFFDHLSRMLQEAEENLKDQTYVDAIESNFGHRAVGEVPPSPLPVINGCTTCRGYCCWEGGGDAFLTTDFIAWQLHRDPALDPAELRDRYIAKLPIDSYEDSCVFHAVDGCRLSRDMRNNICNDFYCSGLLDVEEIFDAHRVVASVAVASENGRVKRVGIMPAQGLRREIDVSPPTESNND